MGQERQESGESYPNFFSIPFLPQPGQDYERISTILAFPALSRSSVQRLYLNRQHGRQISAQIGDKLSLRFAFTTQPLVNDGATLLRSADGSPDPCSLIALHHRRR